ncbi:hypothetical protein G6R40_01210 [Chryseobacterium sp. POL2]|uniref:hypothetical protein n=1 Tax=Chryseobacterium sp. POL2 TaxID=2713414 RepID=UPI0013E1AACD|nr:hypothetical protein [Chryseobacterium sp. POL2]QIG88357.1 hypothetical protein G6R40_01210 [Chryseobacterium sp. POL2]
MAGLEDGIKFKIGADHSEFMKAVEESGIRLKGFTQFAREAGENIDSAFVEALKTIEAQKTALAELQKKYDDLQKTPTKIGNDEEVAAFTQEINRLKEEIDLYKNKINEMNLVLESFSNKNVNLTQDLEEVREKIVKTTSENYTIEALGVTKENIVIQKQYIKELESQLKELQKTIDDMAPSKAKLTVMGEASSIAKEIELEKKALLELEEALRNTEKEHISLREKLSTVRSEMEALSADNKRNTAEYNELKEKAQEYSAQLKQVADDLKPNIDNHDNLREKLSSVKTEMEALMLSGKGQSEEYEELKGKAQEYSQMIVQVAKDIKPLEEKNTTLQSKLRAVKEEMLQLAAAGEKDSAQYNELRKQAIAYQSELQQMNKELKSLSGSTSITAMVNSLGLLSGGLSAANGFMAMFAGNNENLDKIMVRLQATMSAAIGIQQIQNSLAKESGVIQSVVAVQTLAKAKAEALATKNTIGATIAQRAFNLVAKANPYVLLAAGLVTVVGALVMFSGKTKKAAEDQEKLNKATADGAAENIVKYKQLQTAWNALGGDLKKQQKYIEENKDKFHELGREVNNVNEAEKFFNTNSNDFIESLKLRAEAAAHAQIAVEKYKEAILADKEIEQFDKDWENAGFFGKVWLGAKASYNRMDVAVGGKGGDKSRVEAQKELEKELELKKRADELGKKAANPYNGGSGKTPKTKTAKKAADEFLPPGSVAEIQKRLSEIDKALSKATGDKQIADLKTKRIALAKELAEAEKKIQIQSLQQQFDESQKLWTDYYSTIESLGKPTADKIYGDLLANDSSQFEQLQKKQQELLAKANTADKDGKSLITDEEKEVLSEVSQIINEMLGKQSQLDQFKQNVADTLSTMATEAEKIKYLEDIQKTASKDSGEYAYVVEQERAIQDQLRQQYQQFLNDHRSFEEQKAIITERFAKIREQIASDETLSASQKSDAMAKAGQAEADEFSRAFMDSISNNPAFRQAFANMEHQATSSLEALRGKLIKKLEDLKASGKGTIEAIEQLKNSIGSINDMLSSRNPFVDLKKLIKDLGDESLTTSQKIALINEANQKVQSNIGFLKGAVNDIQGIAKDLGLSLDNAFGDALEKIGGVLDGLDQMSDGLTDMAKGFATGNPIQMVTGGIKAIGGIVKAVGSLFNNDRKKERNIKKWANEVANLKEQYEQLQHAINKALGEDVYKNQLDQVKNLQQQQAKLRQMISEERSKKDTDDGKIADWENQIRQMDRMIDDIRDNIIKDVLQTDVKQLASGLADALVDAFEKGEDAAKSLDKVANDVFKNMVKHALQMRMQDGLQDVLNQVLAAAGFDKNGNGSFAGFSPEQIAYYKNLIAQVGLQQQGFLDAYSSLFADGISASNLEGAIKGVSEETASIIAGQMNAIRIMQAEALQGQQSGFDLMQQQLNQLVMIEFNTRYLRLIYAAMGKSNNDDLRANGLI